MTTPSIYGVFVGVGAYPRLNPLACPAADATDLADVLQSGHLAPRVTLLTDAAATKPALMDGLASLALQAGAEDTALVYLSGHGGRASDDPGAPAYFCPVETDPLDLAGTAVSGDELTAAFRRIRAARLIVLLDTCFSGGIGEPRQFRPTLAAGLNGQDVLGLVEGRGRLVMAASRPDELAWELAGMRNGLFTSCLLRALRGEAARADGTVWASELFSFVSREVRRHGLQHPYQKAVGEDFVVYARRNTAPHQQAPQLDDRSLRLAMRGAYNRAELALLCRDLGLSLEDLSAATIENQLMELIDHCQRHGLRDRLLERISEDRPRLLLGG